MWTADDAPALVGFGASAIGALPQGYAQNASPLHQYRAAIEAGRAAVVRGIALDDDDRLRRAVIERLMCDLAVDLDELCAIYGREAGIFAGELAALAPMIEDGLVAVDAARISITEEARPLLRSVCAVFDRYLDGGAGRHSVAV